MGTISDTNIVIQQGGHIRKIQAPKEQPINSNQMETVVKEAEEKNKITVQQPEEAEKEREKEKKRNEQEKKKQRHNKAKSNQEQADSDTTPAPDGSTGYNLNTIA